MHNPLHAFPGYELLAAIIDSLPDPTFGISPDGIVIAWNRAIEEFSGIKAGDILGKGNYEYSLPFYGLRRPMLIDMLKLPDKEIHQLFPHFTRNNDQISFEFQAKNIDGHDTYYRTTATPILGQDKTPLGFIQTIYDLTREKEIEEELIRQKESLTTILENSLAAFVVDSPNGQLTYFNPRVTEITGYTVNDAHTSQDLFDQAYPDPEYRQAVMSEWGSQLNSNNKARLVTNMVTKDGKIKHVDFQTVRLMDGTIISSGWDLTPQKEIEEELIRQKESLNVILENSPVGIIVIDPNGRFLFMNDRVVDFLGYTLEDFSTEEELFKVLYPDDEQRPTIADNWLKQLNDTGKAFNSLVIRHKDGSHRYLSFQAIRLPDGRVINSVWDQTPEKEIELELIREKEAFKLILENSLIGSALVGQDGRVIYANERLIDITGYSLKEIYSGVAGLKMVFHDDDDAELKIKEWHDQLNTKGMARLTSKLWNNYGSLRYVDFQAVKLADGRMVVSLLDLTPQKEVEQELLRQKELLDTILNYNPAGTALIDVDDQALYANEKAMEFTGYTIEELPTYESWLKLAYHDDENAAKRIAELYEQLKTGNLVSDNGRILQKDGTVKSVDFQAIKLIDGRTIVSIWDVTKQKEIEEEIIRQKDSLYRILENSPVGSAVVDADGRIVFLNQRVLKITGYTADDIPTEDAWFKLAYPDDAYRNEMAKDWRRQLDTANKARGIARIMHKDGKVRHLDFQAVRLQDGTTIHSIWDLTHQKEIEEALRASEEKFRALSDASLEGILFLENGFCVEANTKGAEMLGYPYEELIGIPVMDLIAPEFKQLVAENVKSGYMLPYEITAQRKDGRHLPLEVQGRTFSYLGREVRATVMVDLSERVQAQKQIEAQNSHLTSLFTSSPDALVLDTNEDKISEINPQFTALFGYTREECIGQSLKDLILPEEWVAEYSYNIVDAPLVHPITMETIRKHKSGQRIDVLVKVVPVPGFGNYIMYSDIRERKRIEKIIQNQMRELEAKNEEMERFTYTVSHDLRSPLITIQGFASLLVEDIKSGEYKRLESDLARIINASSKMDQLLQDLLELSRVGRMLNPPSDFPVGEVVDEVVELLHGPISISGVNIIVDDEFPIVSGDRSRIREVFQNLIENAIKFMGSQSEPQIQIGHSFRNDESIFFVRDNGMGIESHYLKKVFGLFEQLSANNQGTGIGLALVKRIIEFHDGRVWAESDGLNKGSTFFFTLPTPTAKREE